MISLFTDFFFMDGTGRVERHLVMDYKIIIDYIKVINNEYFNECSYIYKLQMNI